MTTPSTQSRSDREHHDRPGPLQVMGWFVLRPAHLDHLHKRPHPGSLTVPARLLSATFLWLPFALVSLAAVLRLFPIATESFWWLPPLTLLSALGSWWTICYGPRSSDKGGSDDVHQIYYVFAAAAFVGVFAILLDTPGRWADIVIAGALLLAILAATLINGVLGLTIKLTYEISIFLVTFILTPVVTARVLIPTLQSEAAGAVVVLRWVLVIVGSIAPAFLMVFAFQALLKFGQHRQRYLASPAGLSLRVLSLVGLLLAYSALIWFTMLSGWQTFGQWLNDDLTPPTPPETSDPLEIIASQQAAVDVTRQALLAQGQPATVTAVLDGATIEVDLQGRTETVRYLGITVDPPVTSCGSQAKGLNSLLAEGKAVTLVQDVTDRDAEGHLLRYVYDALSGTLINTELMRQGLADIDIHEPDTALAGEFALVRFESINRIEACFPPSD